MKFQLQVSNTKQKIFTQLIKIIPIQNEQRSKLTQYIAFLIYCFDYVLMIYIIAIAQHPIPQFSSSNTIVTVLQGVRALINVCFLVTKLKVFILLQRMCLFVHFLFCGEEYSYNFLFLYLLDIFANVVWVLTIEQRNLHFDSRLFLTPMLSKQLLINVFSLAWVNFKHYFTDNSISYIFLAAALLFIDQIDYIYKQRFKRMLISLDYNCLILSILPFVFRNLEMVYTIQNSITIVVINLVALCVFVYISSLDYGLLFKVEPWAHNLQEREVINYIICLNQLLAQKNEKQINKFMVYHVHNCKQTDCFLKYHHKLKKTFRLQQQSWQILKLFKKQAMLNLLKKYKILNQYMVFNFEDNSQKAITVLDCNSFFHQREDTKYFNKIQQRRVKHQKVITQYINQVNLIPKIEQFANTALQFWSQLTQYKINGSKVIKLGLKKLKLIKQIEETVHKGHILTQKSRILTNICLSYLLNHNQNVASQDDQMHRVKNNFLGCSEASPTLLISAEKENFLKLINANIALVKISGYTKDQILSLKLDALWDKEIRQQHIVLAQKRARLNRQGTGQLIHSYAFIKNRFGYVVVVDAIVYYYDSQGGKSWCVAMQQYLQNQAVLAFNYRRQLIGINQICLPYGFTTNMQGQKLTEDLWNASINCKGGVKLRNRRLFQGKQMVLPKNPAYDYILKYQTNIYFKDRATYFIFTVNKVKSKRNHEEESTLKDIRISVQGSKSMQSSKKHWSNSSDAFQVGNFQFQFNYQKGLFTGSESNKNFTVSKSAFGGQMIAERTEEQYVPFEYTDDIVEMRYWDGKLDFIQNLEASIPNFESLPEYKFQQQLDQKLVKQQFQTRTTLTSKNVKLLRVFLVIFLLVVLLLLLYINISAQKNFQTLQLELTIQQFGLKQLSQLATLSTILLSQKYNTNTDMTPALNEMISNIDDLYQKIQIDTQSLYLEMISKDVGQYTLPKSDAIYRLLIKNYLNDPTLGINSILAHFLSFIQSGWIDIISSDYYRSQNNSQASINGIFVFIGATVLLVLVLSVAYIKIWNKIDSQTNQLCEIFVKIQPQAIIAQVQKLKSFKDYMDYGRDLFKQQTNENIEQLGQQQFEYPYQKRIVNKYRHITPAILFSISLACVIGCLGTFAYQEYKIQSSYQQIINLYHQSQRLSIDLKSIWIRLNVQPINESQINIKKQEIHSNHRQLQVLTLSMFQNPYLQDIANYTTYFIYGNVCTNFLLNCSQISRTLSKDGIKSIISSFLIKAQKCLSKISNTTAITSLYQTNNMLKIDTNYLNNVNYIISEGINKTVKNIIQNKNSTYGAYFSILVVGIIFIILWYRNFAKNIDQIMELEIILWCIPFKVLQFNQRYHKYLENIKIKQR